MAWKEAAHCGHINKRGQQGSRTGARPTRGWKEHSKKGQQGQHGGTETSREQRDRERRCPKESKEKNERKGCSRVCFSSTAGKMP